MKTTIFAGFAGSFIISILIASTAIAQEPGSRQQRRPSVHSPSKNVKNSDYSYSIFSTPDNALGYVIFQKGTQVFQQASLKFLGTNGRMYYLNNVEVEKAAAFTIEKIRQGKFPLLTIAELKQVAIQ